jgi:error-prone DNA polymerase
VHRAPEFYASLLNNQPMGFYTPATIVKDAQRHGVKILPVCVQQSDWRCTIVSDQRPSPSSSPWSGRGGREAPVRVGDDNTVRLGFCVVNGLRQEHGEQIEREQKHRRFESLDDFKRRVPIAKHELRVLAELGALNCFAEHRRAAMWRVEETVHDDLLGSATLGSTGCQPVASGSLPDALERVCMRGVETGLRQAAANYRLAACAPQNSQSPLAPMTLPERVKADYETMNLTTGPHPMKLLRENLPNIWRAIDLVEARHGSTIQIAGNVICRQRPGTAKGFVFISLEDETGVSNAIVEPDLFERFRLVITEEAFLLIEGQVQNSDGVVLIKAQDIKPLIHEKLVGSESHDFH